MSKNLKFICPLIVVADIKKSRHFYETALGQTVLYDFGENISFQGNFAIHLQAHYQSLIDGKEIQKKSNNFELYFEFDDIESIVKKLELEAISFVHPIREQPWRQRVVRFYDPDFHIIEIGESMEYLSYRLSVEGKSVEEICTITMMPAQFVMDSIESYNK